MDVKQLESATFDKQVNREPGLFIVQFTSPTCGPCQQMSPVLSEFAKRNPATRVFRIDVMESPDIAERFAIRSVPAIHFCRGREILHSFKGLTPLGNLQYALNNIGGDYFKKHGTFETVAIPPDYTFRFLVAGIIVAFLLLFILY